MAPHFTSEERSVLDELLKSGESKAKIAILLKRDRAPFAARSNAIPGSTVTSRIQSGQSSRMARPPAPSSEIFFVANAHFCLSSKLESLIAASTGLRTCFVGLRGAPAGATLEHQLQHLFHHAPSRHDLPMALSPGRHPRSWRREKKQPRPHAHQSLLAPRPGSRQARHNTDSQNA